MTHAGIVSLRNWTRLHSLGLAVLTNPCIVCIGPLTLKAKIAISGTLIKLDLHGLDEFVHEFFSLIFIRLSSTFSGWL